MKEYFENLIISADLCTSDPEFRLRFVSGVRLMLQQIVYGMLDWLALSQPGEDALPGSDLAESLLAPSDGDLVDALDTLLILAEKAGWTRAALILTKPVEGRAAKRICGKGTNNTMGLLRQIVALRNDSAEGHGLIGGYDREAEKDAFEFLLNVFESVIPAVLPNRKSTAIGKDGLSKNLRFVQAWDGVPALIRKIQVLSDSKVRVDFQYIKNDVRDKFTAELDNIFFGFPVKVLPQPEIWDNSWRPICYIPSRTTDSFTGRSEQIVDLKEWLDDVGLRACLIYGDGGYGKTTLLLEFLHRVLDEEIEVDWRPEVVVFYTAKRWQWGINGLQPIRPGEPHLLELMAFLNTVLFGKTPPQSFYRLDVSRAASQLQGRIKNELKLERENILLVIDNSETLIQDEQERATLGKELNEIAKRVGRVILTSRRHEHFGATPVRIDVLSETEALKFLKDRAGKLKLKIVERASDDQILGVIQRLERRPIVLEALISALSDPSVKRLNDAADRVAAMLRKDLGEFLFADAWARLNPEVKRLLLLMAKVADFHDGQSLKICADMVGVPAQAAEHALEESGGIASIVSVKGNVQVTFTKNFVDFAADKKINLHNGRVSPSADEVARAQSQYSAFIKRSQQFAGDRIAQAFRTPQAKAAHRAKQEGNIEECRRLYEAAVLTDSANGWLFDRYAYFVFHDLRDNKMALHQAKKAVELLPSEGEVWYTRGVIEARLGDVKACELSMSKAEDLGVFWPRCAVQRSWAYLKARPAQLGLAKREIGKLRAYLISESDYRIRIELERIERRLDWLESKRSMNEA